MICTLRQIFARSNRGGWYRREMWHACERRNTHTEFWQGKLKGGDLSVDGIVDLTWISKIRDRKASTGLTWLWTRTSSGLVCTVQGKESSRSTKYRQFIKPTDELLVSEGLHGVS